GVGPLQHAFITKQLVQLIAASGALCDEIRCHLTLLCLCLSLRGASDVTAAGCRRLLGRAGPNADAPWKPSRPRSSTLRFATRPTKKHVGLGCSACRRHTCCPLSPKRKFGTSV